ncbi:MAG: hypothetical protein KA746_07460 [Pyrinomonadaceae bacterium]|nr:hypothetical protein [Pyrinomonadaceae bacterium]MBP6212470.1 hypothetical protein [Pyrinomonadaceae bacterium]
MRLVITSLFVLLSAGTISFGQKGVDTQTQKIKDEGNKVTTRPTDASRSFDWGKGKTRVRDRLANPYKLNSRRDVLLETIAEVLREKRIIIDEAASRPKDGIIVTQPFAFAKGPVTTKSELGRYGVLDYSDSAWSRAQYSLTIEVQSIDGIQNNVSVIAKVEGRAGNGLSSEWRLVPSSGLAEDEFLSKLVEMVTGTSPDPTQETGPQ